MNDGKIINDINNLTLKDVRNLAGYTQLESAKAINLKLKTYTQKEQGLRNFSVEEGLRLYVFLNKQLKRRKYELSAIDFFYIIAKNNEKKE